MMVKMDYDGIYRPCSVARRMVELERELGIEFMFMSVYKSKKGYHLRAEIDGGMVRMKEYPVRVFIQGYLLSDRKRELFNLRRYLEMGPKAEKYDALFSKKYRVKGGAVEQIGAETDAPGATATLLLCLALCRLFL